MKHKPTIYLAGAMEKSPDNGVGWRLRIEKWLEENGWIVFNPCKRELNIFSSRGVTAESFSKLKTKKTLSTFQSIMSDLIDYDLDTIRNSDVVLVYWDEYVAGGTFHEMGYADQIGVPIVIMSKVPLKKMSGWYLTFARKIFWKWKDVKEFLTIVPKKRKRRSNYVSRTMRPS